MLDKAESIRLHYDWWGKCRTCAFWDGADGPRGNQPRWEDSPCTNPRSESFNEITDTDFGCKKWDSFDLDTALELIAEGDKCEANR